MKRAGWAIVVGAVALLAGVLWVRGRTAPQPAVAPPVAPPKPVPPAPPRPPEPKMTPSTPPPPVPPPPPAGPPTFAERMKAILGGRHAATPADLKWLGENRPGSTAALLAAARDATANVNAREKAITLLGVLGDAEALPALLGLASDDPSAEIRGMALGALPGFAGQVPAARVAALMDAAKTDDERTRAVEVLGELGDPASIPAVERVTASFTDSVQAEVARQALAKLRALSAPDRDARLAQLLYDPSIGLQEWSIRKLTDTRSPAAAGHLRTAFDAQSGRPQPNPALQQRMLAALRTLGADLAPAERAWLDAYAPSTSRPYGKP